MTQSVGDRGSHTPGPWRVAVGNDDAVYPRTSERQLEVCCLPHSTFDAVDIYAPGDHFSEPEWGEFIANARLIAAAPALLEACRELTEQLALLANDPATNPWVQQGRAAIQSATGEG